MFSPGEWLCAPHSLDAQFKTWSLICVPSNKRRSGGIPLCMPLWSTGLSGLENRDLQVLRWALTRSRHSDSTFSSLIFLCLFRRTFFQSSCEECNEFSACQAFQLHRWTAETISGRDKNLFLQVRTQKGFLWGRGSAWELWSKSHVHLPALAGFLCDL